MRKPRPGDAQQEVEAFEDAASLAPPSRLHAKDVSVQLQLVSKRLKKSSRHCVSPPRFKRNRAGPWASPHSSSPRSSSPVSSRHFGGRFRMERPDDIVFQSPTTSSPRASPCSSPLPCPSFDLGAPLKRARRPPSPPSPPMKKTPRRRSPRLLFPQHGSVLSVPLSGKDFFATNFVDRVPFAKGTAVVYKARYIRDNKVYAVKEISKRGSAAHELAVSTRLHHPEPHPRILVHHCGWLETGKQGLVMDLCKAGSLGEYLFHKEATNGLPLPPARVWSLVSDVVGALVRFHERGFAHLDLKPENLLFDKEGRLVLCDFGIAAEQGSVLLHVGTKPYYAPELLDDEDPICHPAADMYSLGHIIIDMLGQDHPQPRESLWEASPSAFTAYAGSSSTSSTSTSSSSSSAACSFASSTFTSSAASSKSLLHPTSSTMSSTTCSSTLSSPLYMHASPLPAAAAAAAAAYMHQCSPVSIAPGPPEPPPTTTTATPGKLPSPIPDTATTITTATTNITFATPSDLTAPTTPAKGEEGAATPLPDSYQPLLQLVDELLHPLPRLRPTAAQVWSRVQQYHGQGHDDDDDDDDDDDKQDDDDQPTTTSTSPSTTEGSTRAQPEQEEATPTTPRKRTRAATCDADPQEQQALQAEQQCAQEHCSTGSEALTPVASSSSGSPLLCPLTLHCASSMNALVRSVSLGGGVSPGSPVAAGESAADTTATSSRLRRSVSLSGSLLAHTEPPPAVYTSTGFQLPPHKQLHQSLAPDTMAEMERTSPKDKKRRHVTKKRLFCMV